MPAARDDAPSSVPSGDAVAGSAAPLRPRDLVEHRFGAPGWFREGYSADSVDDWLDQAAAALAAHERGDADAGVAAADVEAVRFPTKRGAAAYAMDEVDGLLERVAATLRALEASAARRR
jgi:DivIVA domain-containing protein